jgi:hypothetical protein
MKSALFLLFISALLCLSLAQRYPADSKPVYKPFTQEEMKEYKPREEV